MLRCRTMRGRMAAAAYGDLDGRDREALDRHLAACPRCRAEAEALARLVARIPVTRPEPGIDLVRAARRRIDEAEARRAVPAWRWAAGALAAALLIVGAIALFQGLPPRPEPGPLAGASPLRGALDDARHLLAAGNYTAAYDTLSEAVRAHREDPGAGEAQLMLAELAFQRHWYDKAHAAYRDLMAGYHDTVQASPRRDDIVRTWNLLDEGHATQYAQLYGLDQARRNPAGAFEAYEDIVAQNPNTEAAYEAMRGMVALLDTGAAPDQPESVLAAMQAVRDKCKNPIAIAKLDYEIGHRAWRDLNDIGLARESFEKAAASSDRVLARRAKESLEQLSTERSNPS